MKVLNRILEFLLSIIIMLSGFFIYDGYLLSNWSYSRLLEKFEISIILNNSDSLDDFIKDIKSLEDKNFKFKEVNFMSKEELFNEFKQNSEFSAILSVIEENPFFDFVKIKFLSYSKNKISKLLEIAKSKSFVKEVIFDYNIRTYLARLVFVVKFLNILLVAFIIIIFVITFSQLLSFFHHKKTYIFNIVFFTLFYIFCLFENMKILNFLTNTKIVTDLIMILFYILLYITCILTINNNYESN
jgi:hypothetical protein